MSAYLNGCSVLKAAPIVSLSLKVNEKKPEGASLGLSDQIKMDRGAELVSMERWRWALIKRRSWMKAYQAFETHRDRIKSLCGSRKRMSKTTSVGRIDMVG
ncbi:unnamed protein product [Prunus armeniaca]|uniref:Uncharacterized protein n=1 Tax=Prunus armeniaca TaxID=36596 RepID=A0A6J5VYS1_PRUAR|nr:unnamed protein product [Prunus armeniaca]